MTVHIKSTKRIRYRKNWRNKMILQVEILVQVDEDVGHGLGTHSQWVSKWRDATQQDMLELKLEWVR